MAERQMRFLSGVTGHDPTATRHRCAKCGGVKAQPSAAELAGLAPPAPDMVAALRAARTVPSEPQRFSILAQPALPTESHLEALTETVPSPAFEVMRDSLIAFRDSLKKRR